MEAYERARIIAEDLLYANGNGAGNKLGYFVYRLRQDGQIEATEYSNDGEVVETYVVGISLYAVTPGQ